MELLAAREPAALVEFHLGLVPLTLEQQGVAALGVAQRRQKLVTAVERLYAVEVGDGRLVYKLAELLMLRRRAGDALRYVEEAVELNRKVGDPVWVVDSLLLKSEILLALKRIEEARRCVRSAKTEVGLVPRSNVSELERLTNWLDELEELLVTRQLEG